MSDTRNTGDAWVTAADGQRYWGRFGAAGLLVHDPAKGILLQHRVSWSDHGGTWGIPGGAKHEGESAIAGAKRESLEEAGVPTQATVPTYTHVLNRGGWKYTTVIAEVTTPFHPEITDAESHALAWVPVDQVADYPLHPAFGDSWGILRPLLCPRPAIVVDAANVVGAVPDGWWKDRRGANARLRDRLALLASQGSPAGLLGLTQHDVPGIDRAFPLWVLVAEGAGRGNDSVTGVRVVDAPGLGDDTIVEETSLLVHEGRRVTVITSDEELQSRVTSLGATKRGAQKLLRRLPDLPHDP
ncbi:NUDIX domain-containing protein [Leucobacter sp. W1153]|uniref:NUDIX domain-containing protein n=1 Tax=Leucobacter sp. W1153 TaxID=3439064 RepID=UPI003F41629B